VGLQAKDRTVCGIATSGDGYCWGSNKFGQAGSGTTDSTLAAPTKVAGGLIFTSISAGAAHTCGTTPGGTYCWGCNSGGELGIGSSAHDEPGKGGTCGTVRLSPVRVSGDQTFSDVEASGSFLVYQQDATCSDAICSASSCALTPGGTTYCWGNFILTPTSISQAPQFKSLSSSMATTCGLGTDAVIYCFFAFSGPPASIQPSPIQGVAPMQSVSAGRFHSCSIDRRGRAYCWGANLRGELGSPSAETCSRRIFGSYPCRARPDTVYGGLRFQSVSAGGGTPSTSDGAPISHTCGVTVNQEIYCWGDNTYGQLGNGTQTSAIVPVKISSDLRFRSVATGYGLSCGLTVSGAAYCWGSNPSPRAFPPGISPNILTPTLVTGGVTFK
jgi:Alpha-tubulin suppressor and related RCC1 domain-containing proteins